MQRESRQDPFDVKERVRFVRTVYVLSGPGSVMTLHAVDSEHHRLTLCGVEHRETLNGRRFVDALEFARRRFNCDTCRDRCQAIADYYDRRLPVLAWDALPEDERRAPEGLVGYSGSVAGAMLVLRTAAHSFVDGWQRGRFPEYEKADPFLPLELQRPPYVALRDHLLGWHDAPYRLACYVALALAEPFAQARTWPDEERARGIRRRVAST